ncbi:MAG: hypothetical protein WDZ72_07495 [Cyclobacteriaceae bacterium]
MMHHLSNQIKLIIGAGLVLLVLIGFSLFINGTEEKTENIETMVQADAPLALSEIEDRIEKGKHVATGLIEDEGMHLVIAHCTACHSAKLVTQNRADRAGWKKMIRWMQETQNLWDLGESEEAILNYLADNYAPVKTGRRPPLTDIEWYELKE